MSDIDAMRKRLEELEALAKAITCEACGEYLDGNGECNAGKHHETI